MLTSPLFWGKLQMPWFVAAPIQAHLFVTSDSLPVAGFRVLFYFMGMLDTTHCA